MATKSMETLSSDREMAAPVEIRDSRILRQAAHRNAAERLVEKEQQRHIDAQRRVVHAQLSRDEKQLRDQLQRLQDEQRLLAGEDQYDYHSELCSMMDEEESRESSPEFVNPYPIVFPSSARSTPRPTPRGVRDKEEDTDTQSTNNTLPRIRTPSAINPTRLPSAGATPYTSTSTIQSLRDDQRPPITSRSHTSSSPREQSLWLADPEAIHSVRRARKSVAQQRMEHKWTRSQSLKERQIPKPDTTRRVSVSRSKSMREPTPTNVGPGEVVHLGAAGGRPVSRSTSLRQTTRGSSGMLRNVQDALGHMTVTSTEVTHRSPSGSRRSSTSSASSLQADPNKSSTWGFLADPLPEKYNSQHFNPAPVKPKRQKKLSCPTLTITLVSPDLTRSSSSPLPPITSPCDDNEQRPGMVGSGETLMLSPGQLPPTPPPSPLKPGPADNKSTFTGADSSVISRTRGISL